MKFKTIVIVFFLLSFIKCSSPNEVRKETVLMYNKKISKGYLNNDKWIHNYYYIIEHLVGGEMYSKKRTIKIEVLEGIESPKKMEVEVLVEGIISDSENTNSHYKFILQFNKEKEQWEVIGS